MTYLRNAWYAAGWTNDIAQAPVSITIHDQPIVIYRTEDGVLNALFDACPHRFAPLSRGRVDGNLIMCGYHGLTFDQGGRCVRNPHGKGALPPALSVRAYPLVERYGMAWVWLGQVEAADPATIPAFPALVDPGLTWVYGQLHVNAHYELVTDNLLDLSHVEFLHPLLGNPGNAERTSFRAEQEGTRVSAYYDMPREPVTDLHKPLWIGADPIGNARVYMHWHAPASMYLDVGIIPLDRPIEEGTATPSVHLLTPETENSTHYFWATGRNRQRDNVELGEGMRAGIQYAFQHEDEPMISAVRSRMHSNDLFAHKPALLPMDEAAVRARRILGKLIAEEQAAAA